MRHSGRPAARAVSTKRLGGPGECPRRHHVHEYGPACRDSRMLIRGFATPRPRGPDAVSTRSRSSPSPSPNCWAAHPRRRTPARRGAHPHLRGTLRHTRLDRPRRHLRDTIRTKRKAPGGTIWTSFLLAHPAALSDEETVGQLASLVVLGAVPTAAWIGYHPPRLLTEPPTRARGRRRGDVRTAMNETLSTRCPVANSRCTTHARPKPCTAWGSPGVPACQPRATDWIQPTGAGDARIASSRVVGRNHRCPAPGRPPRSRRPPTRMLSIRYGISVLRFHRRRKSMAHSCIVPPMSACFFPSAESDRLKTNKVYDTRTGRLRP